MPDVLDINQWFSRKKLAPFNLKSLKASPTIPIPLELRISAMRDSIRVPSGPILLTNERPTIIRVHDDTDEIRERHGDEFDNEFIHREITPY